MEGPHASALWVVPVGHVRGRDVVMSKLKQLVLGAQRARQQSSGRGVAAGMRGVRWVGLGAA